MYRHSNLNCKLKMANLRYTFICEIANCKELQMLKTCAHIASFAFKSISRERANTN